MDLAPDVTASPRAMKNRDGATPYSTYVRGVIIEGDRGVLLTGSGDSAQVIEG